MKTLVIAEIGSCFESWQDIEESIRVIKDMGAVPKLQAYHPEKLCSKERDPKQYETLCHYELPEEYIVKAGSMGAFFSVFDRDMVAFLEESVAPSIYKVSSPDCNNFPLIDVCVRTKKRVIVSESASYPAEARWNGTEYLYCVPAYPASHAMLDNMKDHVGYSDHTTSLLVPALAVAKGANVIEKHFKLRDMQTPDAPHSLLPKQFKQMIELIKEAEHHLPENKNTLNEELSNLDRARRGSDGLRPLVAR